MLVGSRGKAELLPLPLLILHRLAKLALLVVRREALVAGVFAGQNPFFRFVFQTAHRETTQAKFLLRLRGLASSGSTFPSLIDARHLGQGS